MAKCVARETQKRIFRAFRMAYVTGRHARYLQGLCQEYGILKNERNVKAKNFCKFFEQATRIYKNYKTEFMTMTKEEKTAYEAWKSRVQAVGRRTSNFAVSTGVTRA